jgi:ABC-type glutathione transport system ATPase component
MPLLQVENLGVYRTGHAAPAIDGIGFELERGATLAVVGESGSGKSTLCLALAGLLTGAGVRIAGRVLFDGIDLRTLPERDLRRLRGRRLSMIFQDPLAALHPCLAIGEQLAEPLRNHRGLPRRAARAQALEWLERVGIDAPERRAAGYAHELSGGMRQRVMIAMALIAGPDLLLADEPTAALDVTTQAQILALLERLQRDSGIAMIFVTHNLAVAARLADRLLVMHGGRCIEQGAARQMIRQPRDPATRRLIDAVPGRMPPARSLPIPGTVLLRVENITVRRGIGVPAVADAAFELREGEILGLVGESGSGKSTLARALLRLVQLQEGRILLDDREWSALSGAQLRELRPRVQMIFQDPSASLDPSMTVRNCLEEALFAAAPGAGAPREVAALLEEVGIDPASADRLPHQFSGGQCQRIAIARALALQPRLLVADEPVSALDVTVQARIIELLLRLNAMRRLSIIFISHDLAVVRSIAHRIAVMQRGRIVELDDAESLWRSPAHPCTGALLAALPPWPPDWEIARRVPE